MTERIRYFALVLDDRPATNPYSVFREVHSDDDYRTDIWNRGAWRIELPLAKYILCGEIGALPIPKVLADHLIATAPQGVRLTPVDPRPAQAHNRGGWAVTSEWLPERMDDRRPV